MAKRPDANDIARERGPAGLRAEFDQAPREASGRRPNGADGVVFIRTGDQFRREYEPLKYAIDDLLVQGQ